jgi:hypothetical protein
MTDPQLLREVTAQQIAELNQNPHAVLMQWAYDWFACWHRHQAQQLPDTREWHVAQVQISRWQAMIEMLKARAS